MKKYLLLIVLAIFAISCSKKVEVKGKVINASPMERIEIIEASGVGTLPLMNVGINTKGEFSGSFEAPKNGLYVITYGRNSNMVYLKGGQTLNISGSGANFPTDLVISGDAKANNDFMKESQKAFEGYASKINMQDLIMKDEPAFITQFKKIQGDVFKILEDQSKKYKADGDALQYKKDEISARLMGLLDAYEEQHGQLKANPSFKVSANFKKIKDEMLKNNDRMIKDFPMYREYQVNKLNDDFQKYMGTQPQNPKVQPMFSEVFSNYLKTRKDLSQTAKDYFFAYILAQSDLNFMNAKNYDKLTKMIDDNIADGKVKSDLKDLQKVLMGYKAGTVPDLKLTSADGKAASLSDFKGKPTLVAFYASWNPNIAMMTVPVLKEVTAYYKDKVNYAYVNLDDTQEQFKKTSAALLKGFPGKHYWVEGGLNSGAAKKFGLYGFKIPSFVLLDKDGKLYGRPYFNLGDPEFVDTMAKLTGLKAPEVAQQLPQPQVQEVPQGAEPAPATSRQQPAAPVK